MFTLTKLSFANVLFITVSPILDILIVWLLFDLSALGHYIVLLYMPLFIHKIPTTLFSMFPHVAIVKTRASQDITQISKQVLKWIFLLTIPLLVVILLYPETLLSNLFHKSYIKDLTVVRILAISYFLQSISWTAERILIAKNKKVQRVISNYIFGSLFIVLSLFFAFFAFGLFGIALAYLISSVTDAFVKYILVVWKTKVLFIGKDHVKIFFAGAFASLLSNVLFFNNPLLFFPFFLALYLAILWTIGIIGKKSLFDFKKMVTKEVGIGGSLDYD